MGDMIEVPFGRWVRHSGYEIRDGYIRPTEGARVEEYDPWDEYQATRASRQEQPLYQSLVNLVRQLRPLRSPEEDTLITEWCRKYGLLGILPHCVAQVVFPPRPEPVPNVPYYRGGERLEFVAPCTHRFIRTGIGWLDERSFNWRIPQGEDERGEAIRAEMARVYWQDLSTAEWRDMPFTEGWAAFFPDLRVELHESYFYPVPGSPDFWAQYAEPVRVFRDAATAFAETVILLKSAGPWDRMPDDHRQRVARGMLMLNVLMAPCASVLMPSDRGTWHQRWRIPSLLSAFALMVAQDLSGRRHIHACAECGAIFISTAYQARFCTEACRSRHQQRAYRRRQRSKS